MANRLTKGIARLGRLNVDGGKIKTGFIDLPLLAAREIQSNDIGEAAVGVNDASGGILGTDTTPALERINGATDKGLRIRWAASGADAIQWTFTYPPDLDDAEDLVVKVRAKSAGATDSPVITVAYFEGVGDANAGGDTGATSATEATVSRTITAANVDLAKVFASVELTPGAHTTDALDIFAAWVEYTRKLD